MLVTSSWLALALIHLMPALVLVVPSLIERLYGVPPTGDVGLLLVHRGALFLAVLAVSAYAAIAPDARRAASLVAGISMVSFLLLYARAGLPPGSLRTIAVADLIGLVPLAIVIWNAWGQAHQAGGS
jgi:hypothetical protein